MPRIFYLDQLSKLDIQKTGEEASNRLTELGENDAIDEFCSEINQQAAQASAEKKIKLEKPIEAEVTAEKQQR